MQKLITTIKKSGFEELRIELSEYHTNGKMYQMASARVYYEDGAVFKPGRNGINVKVELLPALVKALVKAEEEARAGGLL